MDQHTATCAHCQTALEGLAALHAAARELAAEPVRAPASLLDRVMRVVRTEARDDATVSLVTGPDAVTGPDSGRVSTKAVASVIRFAIDTVPGLRLHARHCQVVEPEDAVDVLDVTVEVLVPAEHHLDDRGLRDRIETVVNAHVGLGLRTLKLVAVPVDVAGQSPADADHPVDRPSAAGPERGDRPERSGPA
ncbi:anti-sigma factor [Goodfellowiella coeruleoviolacea]|uniref:Asp23/Gls24 family envelope stress response protein n=1 Tax=Goodfellowiella coeruleoviolacea TaxID=334858 RepID=A0AAE3KDV2_9PSEU|nr:hypothetical protein [Goodfellowiella coeruleoviolacea]MCP2164541.1 hypothetical protein [Goodfellowiella coeruleoviolacea]